LAFLLDESLNVVAVDADESPVFAEAEMGELVG